MTDLDGHQVPPVGTRRYLVGAYAYDINATPDEDGDYPLRQVDGRSYDSWPALYSDLGTWHDELVVVVTVQEIDEVGYESIHAQTCEFGRQLALHIGVDGEHLLDDMLKGER
jgi:hypothetical protein